LVETLAILLKSTCNIIISAAGRGNNFEELNGDAKV